MSCVRANAVTSRFTQADIHDFAQTLLDALLVRIEAAGSPEKVAENDYLMKCALFYLVSRFDMRLTLCIIAAAMRIIVTARQTLTPSYDRTLGRLVNILGVISKNPSNPNFDQYIFESISALMRCAVIIAKEDMRS
jgi:exportin-2 (importin alpha re-exporter)